MVSSASHTPTVALSQMVPKSYSQLIGSHFRGCGLSQDPHRPGQGGGATLCNVANVGGTLRRERGKGELLAETGSTGGREEEVARMLKREEGRFSVCNSWRSNVSGGLEERFVCEVLHRKSPESTGGLAAFVVIWNASHL